MWVNNQKQMLNKYRGRSIEEIKNDVSIKPEEKRRVILLLELGIQPSKSAIASQKIGQATYTATAPECDEAGDVINGLIEKKHIQSIE